MRKSQYGNKMASGFNKKGFEVQFNWIFVLIAGTAIILFFSLVVVKLKGISETSRQGDIVKGIEAIITSASVSIDTTNVVEVPESEIKVDCTSVSSGSVTKQYQNLIFFSPSSIKGNKIVMQTLAFNAPFRSSGLLYAASDRLKYVIVGDNDVAKYINKTLPKELNREIVKAYPSSMRSPGSYRVRLVFTENIDLRSNNIPPSLQDMGDQDVTAVKITGDMEKGALEFYNKKEDKWAADPKGASQYLGRASMIAAVYADTRELYECSMKNAFSRHKLVAEIHIDRTEELKRGISGTNALNLECTNVYETSISHLNSIYDASARLSVAIDSANIQKLHEFSKKLSDENKKAQRFSCQLVY